MKNFKNSAPVVSVLIFIVISINSFRYIYKFGAPSSSPGYSETPIEFWIIRYLFIGLIFAILAIAWKRLRLFEYIAVTVLAASSLYALTNTDSLLIKIAAFHICLSGLLFATTRSMVDSAAVDYAENFIKLLHVLLALFAAFLALQIFLYFWFDILPSHSHKHSILVRFGSVLDDSLAFGVLIPMFAGLIYYGQVDDFLRSVSLVATIFIAVLTGSLTAMATTVIYTFWLMRFQQQKLLSWVLLIALLMVSFHWYFFELWSAKSGSIDGHLEGLQLLSGSLAAKLHGEGFAESGWILLFKNFGIFALLTMLGYHTYIQFVCSRMLRLDSKHKQYIGSVEGLNFAAFIASFNLPVLMIFPVYFLLSIFSAVLFGLAGKLGIGYKS